MRNKRLGFRTKQVIEHFGGGHSGEQVNTFDFLETTPKNLNRGRRLRRVPFREVAQMVGLRTSAQSATKRVGVTNARHSCAIIITMPIASLDPPVELAQLLS